MKIRITILLIPFFIFTGCSSKAQVRGDVRVMFYNTENLFDTEDDPAIQDEDFTPEGKLHWTSKRYHQKLNHLYQTIAAIGTWQPPEIIGFSEVENKKVLLDLIHQTPLSRFNYQIIHFDSPDPRGIDVCLLVNPAKIKVVKQTAIPVNFIDNPRKKTRDILLVQLLMNGSDSLNLLVNHWPSRRAGELESEDARITVATVLKHTVDNIFRQNPMAKIIIMGDFNDEPTNGSILKTLKAQTSVNPPFKNQLFNLSYPLMTGSKIGTHYFRGQWQILDQLIVSGGLLSPHKGLQTNSGNMHICTEKFLLQNDKRNMGVKPFPTYAGPKYLGGYSDHLPVYLDLFWKK